MTRALLADLRALQRDLGNARPLALGADQRPVAPVADDQVRVGVDDGEAVRLELRSEQLQVAPHQHGAGQAISSHGPQRASAPGGRQLPSLGELTASASAR